MPTSYRTALLGAALLALLVPTSAHAQYGSGGAGLVLAIPQGAFADRIDGVGYGLGAEFVVHVPNTPVGFGLAGTFVVYGQETIRERFGGGALGRVDVDVVTTNNIALGHAFVRLQPPIGAFRPYADALVGFSYLFTESRIEDVDFNDDRDIASSTNFDDGAFSYGIGGGVMAQVYSGRPEGTGRAISVFVDARVRYLFGGEADYLREGSIDTDRDGNLTFDVTRSRTDLLLPQLGVTVRF
ncbi:MAG: hypothetical protein ABJF88_10875 [Rhodothermales bacterium]